MLTLHCTLFQDWREFCESFKDLDEFSFASLVRLDSTQDYSEENSIIVTKIQFYAIELSRNREGHNQTIRQNYKPTPRTKRLAKEQMAAETAGGQNLNELENELKMIISGNHKMLQ